MQKNFLTKIYCPVPLQQRPFNEYLNFKKSFVFNLFISKFSIFYLANLFFFNFFLFFFYYFSQFFFNLLLEHAIKIFLVNISILFFFQTLLILRTYLGLFYIKKRLENYIIEYEESSWFDGQLWIKPIKILMQDRLISYYRVSPFLKRLKKTTLYLLSNLILVFLFLLIL